MSFFKKILNDPQEVSKYYIITSIIYFICCIVMGTNIRNLILLLLPLIFTVYFIYLKTESGKRNFNSVNQLISYVFVVFAVISAGYALYYLIEFDDITYYGGKLIAMTSIASYIIATAFYLYWIVVFLLKPHKNKKHINNPSKNSTFFWVILITNIIILAINYWQYLRYGFLTSYLIRALMVDGLSVILFVLRLRYIYLYQDYRFKRSENNVRRNGTII